MSDGARALVIDRSRPVPLDEGGLRAWATAKHVFVSSVMAGMRDERVAVASAIERIGAEPVLFERLGGREDDAETAYLDGVRASDIYFGILGPRYGKPHSSGYSATHLEYDAAVRHGLRIGMWATTAEMDGRQSDFLEELQVFHTTGSYSDADELGRKAEDRLRQLAAEAGSPWCKVDTAVFRAQRFADTGQTVKVTAGIRDDDVVAALEALRPGGWGGRQTTRVTCAGRTHTVQVSEVVVETSAGRIREVQLEATKVDEPSQWHTDVTVEGYGPDDQTEHALRSTLFGEASPLSSSWTPYELVNPFAVIAVAGLSEEHVAGIAEVLLVEELVGNGRAERLTSVRIGPRRQGRRRVALEWLPRRRYSNVVPERRRVAGHVAL